MMSVRAGCPHPLENKQYEIWEHNTYVMCEVLGLARNLAL